MDGTTRELFHILRSVITKTAYIPSQEGIDYLSIYEMASKNKLEAVIYSGIAPFAKMQLEDEQLETWKARNFEITMLEAKKHSSLSALVKACCEKGIKPVLFKGPILANLYPEPLLRISGDTDIFVFAEDRDLFLKILEEREFEKIEEHSKEMVPVFYQSGYQHIIEVHYSLWEDYTGPKMDLLEKMQLTAADTLIEEEIRKERFLTMGYEEHLVYQMFHIIKHFTTQYVGLRYLVDLTLFMEHYWEKIDGKSFWKKMELLGYASFCKTFFQLAIDYLGMPEEVLKGTEHIILGNRELLLEDILSKGREDMDRASWQIYGIMTPYLQGDMAAKQNSFQRKLSMLFPGREALPDWCGYAKKYPILLPVAWGHKVIAWSVRYLVHYISGKNKSQGSMYSVNEKMEAADYRLGLMKEMNLL